MSQNGQHHTLVALVEDRPGVLTRVASMFRPAGVQHRQPSGGEE